MTLFSYILAHDTGATPNPFFGACTLAICKPTIRRVAQPGDWIIATGPARHHTHAKLVYAMRVAEVLSLEHYFHDPRFNNKKPDLADKDPLRHVGDNLYQPDPDGTWSQLPGPRTPEQAPKDLRGKNALIADHFFYFGTNAIPLPPSFQKLIHTNQGHRSQFPNDLVRRFITWLDGKHTPGIHGHPTDAGPVSISSGASTAVRPSKNKPPPARNPLPGAC